MANLDQIEQFNNGNIFPENYDLTYVATKHIATEAISIPNNVLGLLKSKIEEKGLYFGNDDVLSEIVTGLVKGNIILQGPPGTGKTTLAKIICEVFNVDYDEATAISDWTTYDTIGGLQPDFDGKNEILTGKNGCIVESILHCCNTVVKNEHYSGEKQASWLILDELNRCEIDKVFGELFTVFGSDSLSMQRFICLWYEKDENKKRIYIPNRYRIIGAMNNIDKNFVYDISQGLSRRFTFIEILPPEEEYFEKEVKNAKIQSQKRVSEKISVYGGIRIDDSYYANINANSAFIAAEQNLNELIRHIRYAKENDTSYLGLPIGTAQVIDVFETAYITFIIGEYNIAEMKKDEFVSVFDSAIASRIIPQMDGFDFMKLNSFYTAISEKQDFSGFQKTKRAIYKLVH
mgnify:CR=1 FL=1